MPWHIAKSGSCPEGKPWAVIKDSDSSVVACHESEESAESQVAALYASERGQQVGEDRGTIRELWRKFRNMVTQALDAQEVMEGITRQWDGAASNYDSTEAYCRACLIDVNSAAGRDTKAQSHCMLPVKRPGSDSYDIEGIMAAAGGHGLTQVTKPADVPSDEWDNQRKRAANVIISQYNANDKTAPDAIYQIAGKEPPERGLLEQFRAIGMMRVQEQVWALLQTEETWAWPIDVYIGDSGIYTLATREGKLYRIDLALDGEQVRLGEWEQVTEIHEPVAQRMVVQRQADGKWRWLNISASAVLNRVGEIDSRQLFDNMAQRAEETGEYPYRTFYHMGEAFRIGQADLLARDGALYITSGVFDDNPLARAIVRAVQDEPDYWGDSIGYLPLGEPERVEIAEGVLVPVYTDGIHREISTLPENRAASLFTVPSVQQEVNRMRADVLDALERLRDKHGLEQAVIDEFVQVADQTNRSIDEEELITREGEPEPESEPEPEDEAPVEEPKTQERETEEPAGDLDVELDDEAVSAIVDRVAEAQFFTDQAGRIDGIQATITDLVERLAKAEERAGEVERRLVELEKDDEEKQRQWLEDQPRRRTLHVTHRPREAAKQERKGDDGSLADEAEATLAGMPRY